MTFLADKFKDGDLNNLSNMAFVKQILDKYNFNMDAFKAELSRNKWDSVVDNLVHGGISTLASLGYAIASPIFLTTAVGFGAVGIAAFVGSVPYACAKAANRLVRKESEQESFSGDLGKALSFSRECLKKSWEMGLLGIRCALASVIHAVHTAICLLIGVPFAIGTKVTNAVTPMVVDLRRRLLYPGSSFGELPYAGSSGHGSSPFIS